MQPVVKVSAIQCQKFDRDRFKNLSLLSSLLLDSRWSCRHASRSHPVLIVATRCSRAKEITDASDSWLERCRSQARNARNKEMAARNEEISRIGGEGRRERERENGRVSSNCRKQRGRVTSRPLVVPTSSVVVVEVLREATTKKKKKKR